MNISISNIAKIRRHSSTKRSTCNARTHPYIVPTDAQRYFLPMNSRINYYWLKRYLNDWAFFKWLKFLRRNRLQKSSRNKVTRCLKRWRSSDEAFPVELRSYPYSCGIVWSWSQTGENSVRSLAKGGSAFGYPALKAVFLQGQSSGMRRIPVHTNPSHKLSAGFGAIPHFILEEV